MSSTPTPRATIEYDGESVRVLDLQGNEVGCFTKKKALVDLSNHPSCDWFLMNKPGLYGWGHWKCYVENQYKITIPTEAMPKWLMPNPRVKQFSAIRKDGKYAWYIPAVNMVLWVDDINQATIYTTKKAAREIANHRLAGVPGVDIISTKLIDPSASHSPRRTPLWLNDDEEEAA